MRRTLTNLHIQKVLICLALMAPWMVRTIGSTDKNVRLLERERIDRSHSKLLKEYYTQAFNYEQKQGGRAPSSTTKDSHIVDKQKNIKIKKYKGLLQYASIIPFKKGDLKKDCHRLVKKIVDYGFDGVAFFYPVHYSGGNSSNYKMPKKPVYGKHYRYEYANRPDQNEVNQCLKRIADANLKLHFIPHLESIQTLVRPENSEWRLRSGLVLNDYYFRSSFDPLFLFLRDHPKAFRKKGSLQVTLFSEIDPIVLTHPRKANSIRKNVSQRLSQFAVDKPRFYYNSNGDFENGWDLQQVDYRYSCYDIKVFFNRIDGLSPSIYGEKGHVVKNGRPTMKGTTYLYLSRLREKLKELCPKTNFPLNDLDVNFGEFALDENNKDQDYDYFFKHRDHRNHFVQFWNHSSWDHHALTKSIEEIPKRFKSQLFSAESDI